MSNSDDTFGMRLALNDLTHITRTLHGSSEQPQGSSGEAKRQETDAEADPEGE